MTRDGPFGERLRPLLRARQVREFTPEPLTDAELDALTEVARWSGSSRNSQPWWFIVIRDPATISAIHDAGAPTTRGLKTAPAAIAIVLANDPADLEHAFDEGRAAERLLIAAGILGLGAGIAWIQGSARPKSAPGAARLPKSETVLREHWPQD